MTSEQPELDRIIGALRGPATTSELTGENAAVDAMASTLAVTGIDATNVRSIRSARSPRIVAIVAASIIAMGGIAAAGAATFHPSASDRGDIRSADTVSADTVPADTVPDDSVPTDTALDAAVPETTVPLVDDPTTEFDETQCAEGNHGATVSSVAQETPPGPEHGDVVSIAAQSSCGKDAATEDTTADSVAEPLVDDPATEFDETQCAEGNHGATVSSVAQETPSGPGHGEVVAVAAQSSCGKDAATEDVADDTTAATDSTTVDDDDDETHGNSDGKGRGSENRGGHRNGKGKPGG